MPDLFDYLTWRGDLSFHQVPFGPVDGLILTTMCYVRLLGIVPPRPDKAISLKEAAREFLSLPSEEIEKRVRVKRDIDLMAVLAETPRFSDLMLSGYTDYLGEEEQTQFAVISIHLNPQETFVAYRGTDHTLTGWKEDFNMTFQDTVPAQHFAKEYLEHFAQWSQGTLILGGHSKGGNLAVYAAAMCSDEVRDRVKAVYSYDGPGFAETVLNSEGYSEVKSRLHSFVPESAIIGMMLEHRIIHTVVKSSSIGVLQHGPYSWMIEGNDFVQAEDRSKGSHVIDQAVKNWSAGMSDGEREELVETVYDLIQTAEVERVEELIQPRNIRQVIKAVREDPQSIQMVTGMLGELVKTTLLMAKNKENRKAGLFRKKKTKEK